MRIGYSKTFPLPASGCYEKIWLEDEIEATDIEQIRQAQYALKKQVIDFHYESNKAAEKQAAQALQANEESDIADKIRSCTGLKILETYKFAISGNTFLEKIYAEQYLKLNK